MKYIIRFRFTADVEGKSESDALKNATYAIDHHYLENQRHIAISSEGPNNKPKVESETVGAEVEHG